MTDDRIERETLIEAPIARVWELVAQPGFWVADEASLDGTTATEGEVTLTSGPHGDFPVRVEKVQPQTYLSYRWTHRFPGDELTVENSTLVEFILTPEAGSTRLRVVETGFATMAGSDEIRAAALKDNTGGWPEVLAAFKKRVEQLPA